MTHIVECSEEVKQTDRQTDNSVMPTVNYDVRSAKNATD